jgi:hypothetical protein
MPVLYFFVGSTPAGKGGYFDAPEGWNQIVSNPTVWGSSIMIAIRFVPPPLLTLPCWPTRYPQYRILQLLWTGSDQIALCNCSIDDRYLPNPRNLGILSLARLGTIQVAPSHWFQSLVRLSPSPLSHQLTKNLSRVYGTFIFNGITTFPVWTGSHTIEVIPTIVIDSEEDEDSETDVEGMSRSRDAIPRPLARRSGSGRRGEASPLLKSVDWGSRAVMSFWVLGRVEIQLWAMYSIVIRSNPVVSRSMREHEQVVILVVLLCCGEDIADVWTRSDLT